MKVMIVGGITIRTGTTSNGAIFFSDATSGDAEFDGFVQYNHGTNPYMIFGTATDEKFRITDTGLLQGKSHAHDGGLELLSSNNNQSTRLRLQAKSSGGTSHDWYLDSARSADRFTIHDGTTSWFTILGTGEVGINSISPSGVLDLYHATNNTILNVKSGDAGSVINLIDNATRSSIEQNGASLKIVSDTDAAYANSDIRLQVDGATKVDIDSSGQITNTGIETSFVTTMFAANFAKLPTIAVPVLSFVLGLFVSV